MNTICADKMLEDMRGILPPPDYAVRKILHNGFAGEISDLTRFYVLFRWNYGEEKKLLDGFLAGKERLREEITKESSIPKQKKLL